MKLNEAKHILKKAGYLVRSLNEAITKYDSILMNLKNRLDDEGFVAKIKEQYADYTLLIVFFDNDYRMNIYCNDSGFVCDYGKYFESKYGFRFEEEFHKILKTEDDVVELIFSLAE